MYVYSSVRFWGISYQIYPVIDNDVLVVMFEVGWVDVKSAL